ncbi:MAG: hypothetical protein LPK26_15270 [Bacillaceae bacterium]|nr:hypothetical protein [Bacillaceae bacterium]
MVEVEIILDQNGIRVGFAAVTCTGTVNLVKEAAKACHSIRPALWRAAHKIGELPLIVGDLVLFGE